MFALPFYLSLGEGAAFGHDGFDTAVFYHKFSVQPESRSAHGQYAVQRFFKHGHVVTVRRRTVSAAETSRIRADDRNGFSVIVGLQAFVLSVFSQCRAQTQAVQTRPLQFPRKMTMPLQSKGPSAFLSLPGFWQSCPRAGGCSLSAIAIPAISAVAAQFRALYSGAFSFDFTNMATEPLIFFASSGMFFISVVVSRCRDWTSGLKVKRPLSFDRRIIGFWVYRLGWRNARDRIVLFCMNRTNCLPLSASLQ